MINIPENPRTLGLPIPSWREHQRETVERVFADDLDKFITAPTGSGKSVIAAGIACAAAEHEYRTLILTSTKQLQDQIAEDFEDVYILKGKANYKCHLEPRLKVNEAACTVSSSCHAKEDCTYFQRLAEARSSHVVCTNYAMALHILEPEIVGRFDYIVCDESHAVIDWVINHMTCEIGVATLKSVGVDMDGIHDDVKKWLVKAKEACRVRDDVEVNKVRESERKRKRVLSELEKVNSFGEIVFDIDKPWSAPGDVLTMCNMDVSDQARRLLTGRALKKMIYLSATNTLESMKSVGVDPEETEDIDIPSSFPLENRMVYFVPTAKIDYRSTDADMRRMVKRIDEIIAERLDRKGFIPSVSYARAQYIMEHSKFGEIMISHKPGRMLKGLEEYERAEEPCVFVSPAASVGVDLANNLCRYIIIPKVPIMGGGGAILKRRKALDRAWYESYTYKTLVQSCGRGVRSEEDWCETFIIDDNWFWQSKKLRTYAPDWFVESVKKRGHLPYARKIQ